MHHPLQISQFFNFIICVIRSLLSRSYKHQTLGLLSISLTSRGFKPITAIYNHERLVNQNYRIVYSTVQVRRHLLLFDKSLLIHMKTIYIRYVAVFQCLNLVLAGFFFIFLPNSFIGFYHVTNSYLHTSKIETLILKYIQSLAQDEI